MRKVTTIGSSSFIGGENGITAGTPDIERGREGVAILKKVVWYNAVIDLGCASSRPLWVWFKFSRVKVCVVVVYGLTAGEVRERERFLNDLDGVVDRVGNKYRLCVLGDLNRWGGDRMRAEIADAF